MGKLKIMIPILLAFVFRCVVPAQITSQEIDQLVEKAMQKFTVVGVAVAIVKDGRIFHEKGYGIQSMQTKQPVNEHTNFAIASNSKAFTTTALAILVEEGKLSWRDKVVDHIPEFKMYNDYVTANFNIQDLLTHRSGLGLGVGDLMGFPDGSDFTIQDVLRSFQYFQPQSAFRTKYDYDNLLYWVAGEVITRVSRMKWEDFVRERIFRPLQMENTYSSMGQMTDQKNLAMPHSTASGAMKVFAPFAEMINGAAGGIISNVNDLSAWMLVHLNNGKYEKNLEKRLFSQESQREMWKIHTTLNVNRDPRYNSHFAGYGLGWVLTDIKGNLSVSHTGGLPGMLSKTVLIPDIHLGVVVLTNTEIGGAPLFAAVTQTIVDRYLRLEPFDWIETYAQQLRKRESNAESVVAAVWETVKKASCDHLKPEQLLGIYRDNWFGTIEISLKNNQLWFTSHRSPKLNGPLAFYKANTFAIRWEYQDMNADAFATFVLDEEGVAQSINMKGISPDIDFSYDFHDLDLKRVKQK